MNILERARPENSFHCADGAVIGSVYELENKLCTMSSHAFHHHTNQSRNDFHNWIRDVFHDHELASDILIAKNPAEAAAIVRKHLRKALLAKEEIENAIHSVSQVETKPIKAKRKPAKATHKKLSHKLKPQKQQKRRQKKATAKNRKLNKKLSTRQHARTAAKNHSRKNTRRSPSKKDKSTARKHIKKQVNKWLNWLKVIPEL